MKINIREICLGIGVMTLVLWPAAQLLAQDQTQVAAASYTVVRWTVDGGGAVGASSEGYTLSGTAGQPDAGALEANDYLLGGGFWAGGELGETHYRIYLPLVVRD